MFVPRILRLKGVKEPPRKKPEASPKKRKIDDVDEEMVDAIDAEMAGAADEEVTKAANEEAAQPDHKKSKQSGGSNLTTASITPEYLGEVVCGIELILSDYAHQMKDSAQWLETRFREVDGNKKCLHLSAVIENKYLSTLKPTPTQLLVQQALREQPSDYLELVGNDYFVRRRPSTYPLKFVPENSFDIVDDNGVSFWDQRTIYVEPHIGYLCKTPAKVAYWIKVNGGMKNKWLPIQSIETLYSACCFVVLSGNVMHENTWNKWKQPEDWKVMTKVEHTKRTEEYLELLNKT